MILEYLKKERFTPGADDFKETKMKLCVFPNDSIQSYHDKGEIKTRYFNPNNLFSEIHIISPSENDIDETKVKSIAGDAILKIHPIGRLTLLNYRSKLEKIKKIIHKIHPDVIRSYNPLMQGWLASKTAKEFEIPFVLSIHNNYDKDVRNFYKKTKNLKQYLKFLYTGKFIEPFVISNAKKIICVYRFLVPYVKRLGGGEIEVIYNRINLLNFSPQIEPQYKFDEKTIIYVARFDAEKNHECLINAIKDLNVKLILIGKGALYEKLTNLTKKLQIENKVIFIESVPNEQLAKYYTSADIFAAPIKQGGVSIPMLEAMACGLPLIITTREPNETEDIDDVVMFSNNTAEDFRIAINTLINDEKLRNGMIRKGLEKVQHLDGKVMEDKEEKLYKSILQTK